jgi:hypothetical protein
MKNSNSDHVVELGDLVQDRVSGFTGIATSLTEYLNGCRRVQISPKVKDDNSLDNERYFDEPQLKVIESQAFKRVENSSEGARPGGPRPDTPAR